MVEIDCTRYGTALFTIDSKTATSSSVLGPSTRSINSMISHLSSTWDWFHKIISYPLHQAVILETLEPCCRGYPSPDPVDRGSGKIVYWERPNGAANDASPQPTTIPNRACTSRSTTKPRFVSFWTSEIGRNPLFRSG